MATTVETALPASSDTYRSLSAKRLAILAGLSLCLVLSIAVDMAYGPARYTLAEVVSTIWDPASAGNQLRVVIWDIRMPIALMAVTVGACLSLAGAQMQTILANPLASPFTLGISAAASFGADQCLPDGYAGFAFHLRRLDAPRRDGGNDRAAWHRTGLHLQRAAIAA